MGRFTTRTVKGLQMAGFESFLIEPTFVDPEDTLDVTAANLESAGIGTLAATGAGAGLIEWSGRYTFILGDKKQKGEFFRNQEYWCGRSRSFWMPSWRSDFTLAVDGGPPSNNYLRVLPVGFDFLVEAGRYGLMIQTTGYVLDVYQIVSFDASTGELWLIGSLDQVFTTANVMRMSLVRRVRSASDEFDWEHDTDAVASVSVGFIEKPREGVFQ